MESNKQLRDDLMRSEKRADELADALRSSELREKLIIKEVFRLQFDNQMKDYEINRLKEKLENGSK